MIGISNFSAAIFKDNPPIRHTNEELTGLNIEERKRRRSGPDSTEFMQTEGGNGGAYTETALSIQDCTDSSSNVLTKLAKQASQSK